MSAKNFSHEEEIKRYRDIIDMERNFLLDKLSAKEDVISFIAKYVEYGLFDNVTPLKALEIIADHPDMPWYNGRWNVDHKIYAEKFYKRFPKSASVEIKQDSEAKKPHWTDAYMKQVTVKSALEAWKWIHNNGHYEVGLEYKTDKNGLDTNEILAVFFRNHQEKMRVPAKLREEVFSQIQPNTRKFDTRMYALKPTALELVNKV